MTRNVTLTRDGAIATVTLDRPDRRNSLSDAMLTELGAAFSELRDDAAVRVVVVTGAPPVFSAGADAGLKSTMSADERRRAFAERKSQFRRLFERANTVLEGLEQITIAAVNGHAVGGDEDKVWRAALHFPLSAVPPGSVVLAATLFLSFDGVCLAPRKTERPCSARPYTIDVHPILSSDWFHEREVDFGPLVAQGSFSAGVAPQRLGWDVTDVVIAWVERGAANDGLLLKLADGEDDFFSSGPKLPSSEFANTALRPALEVTYLPT